MPVITDGDGKTFSAELGSDLGSKEQSTPVLKNGDLLPPSEATAAVLLESQPIPVDARKVAGIDFDHYPGRNITVAELVAGMSSMGFQATAVADAVRIINDMVCPATKANLTRIVLTNLADLEGSRHRR